jgi:hypothetical protein
VLRNPQHRSFLTVVSATSAPSVSTSSSSANVCHQGGVLADETDGSHYRPSPGCKADVQEVSTIVLEFSPGLLGLYGVWHCHDEAVHLLPVGLEVFCELHIEASTGLHSTIQNLHFHHASENWLTVLPVNPKRQ